MKFNEDTRVKLPTILHLVRLGYQLLIGRAYAAAAERGVSGKNKSEVYLNNLAHRLVKLNLDNYLADLPTKPAKLNVNLSLVVETHYDIDTTYLSSHRHVV
jgi:hypothetical protein